MDFFNYHFPTGLSRLVSVLAFCFFGRNNVNDGRNDGHYGYQGESLGQVAEHAAVYDGVRQGVNALFRSHRYGDDYRHHDRDY